MTQYNIAVAGTGYVGMSIATLLAQHNHITAVDIIPEKVEMINRRQSPVQDEYIEDYLAKKDLDLSATLDACRLLPVIVSEIRFQRGAVLQSPFLSGIPA